MEELKEGWCGSKATNEEGGQPDYRWKLDWSKARIDGRIQLGRYYSDERW